MKLKPVNFIHPPTTDKSWVAYDALVTCIMCGYKHDQAKETIEPLGYTIREDQYLAFEQVVDIQVEMDLNESRRKL